MRGLAAFTAAVLLGSAVIAADPPSSPDGLEGFVRAERLPVPPVAFLAQGREVWASTCENCHGGNKLTGAPKITATGDWAPRIAQGMDRLIAHATDGFMGPRFTEMPARGGNADLSDAEVAAAVAFMVWASGGVQIAVDYSQSQQDKDDGHE